MSLWLLRLYPSAWRQRYGDEFLALVGARTLTVGYATDILRAAAGERGEQAITVLLGASHDERWRSARQIARAIGGRLIASAAGTATFLGIGSWMSEKSPPVFNAATWTPAFAITLLVSTLGIASLTFLLGETVLWVRQRHSEEVAHRPSMLMSVVVILVITIIAEHPSDALGAGSLHLINQALGSDNMLWMITARWALPAALTPWYSGGRSSARAA